VLTLRKYQQICEAINNKEETAWAQKLIDTICGSFHNAFYSEEKKAYTDADLHTENVHYEKY
jgi:hypothetical protein